MSPAHQSGRRRYAERGAAETATNTPAVGHQRASDKRIHISAADANALLLAQTSATECRRCGEVERCDETGLCAACRASIRGRCPEARL